MKFSTDRDIECLQICSIGLAAGAIIFSFAVGLLTPSDRIYLAYDVCKPHTIISYNPIYLAGCYAALDPKFWGVDR